MNKDQLHKRLPTPRKGVYELYWEFAAKRQEVFFSRLAGDPAPWSSDPILQEYKFCNVYRALDRVSQYLIKEICYSDAPTEKADRLFQIILFRNFSKIETWESLSKLLGHPPTLDDLASGTFELALTAIAESKEVMYTNAFILCATDAYGKRRKYLNHVAMFKHMFFGEDIATEIISAKSLRRVYEILHRFPLYGDFMSYQTAIDINYSDLINFSENEFTVPGPGALRGINKIFQDLGDYSPTEVVLWMVQKQNEEFEKLGIDFKNLFGRKIHAIDAQNLFCETDKYCRVRVPELTSTRKRIKTTFKPKDQPIDLYLPPKWNLNIPS